MPTRRSPRKGSLQFWPRKRAKKARARVRSNLKSQEAKLLMFPGYKVGMTHLIALDNRAASITKGEEIVIPSTIVECPPIKIFAVNFYKKSTHGLSLSSTLCSQKLNKEISRVVPVPKKTKKKLDDYKPEEYEDIRIVAYTQPRMTVIGKKKPEIFEIKIGGKVADKFNFIKEHFDKEISLKDVFKDGQCIDIHAITKGKGFQGPVKRFGVAIRHHKSEKTKRGPGSLGPWKGQGHIMWRVAHAGQMGYHQRTDYNKQVVKIGEKPEEVNPKEGFKNYGIIKNPYAIIKGSISGTRKRMIILSESIRPDKRIKDAPDVRYISQ